MLIKVHLCKTCGETDPDKFYGHMKSMCCRCFNDSMLKRQGKIRSEVVNLLGNVCVRCGFDDIRALHIDHVNGGGRAERQAIGYSRERYLKFVLAKIKKGSRDYQLLCANCNFIKLIENKERMLV